MNRKRGRKMKVMLVAPHLNLGNGGGSEKQTIALANGLVRKGCVVTLLLTDGKGGDLVSELSTGVEVVRRGAGNFFSRFAAIHKTAKEKKPDIIYGRLWKIKPAAVCAGKILGIKTVLVEVNNLRKKLDAHPPVLRPLVKAAKTLCYRTADRVIAISEEGGREIRALTGVDALTVYNGTDPKRIRERAEEKAEHEWFGGGIPIAVAVGRLRPQKGYEDLVEAAGAVNGETPLRLLIIGGGPLKDKISDRAEKLGIRHRVDFTGPVSNPHKYTAKCDIFVCSSLFEGFGLVLAEALALGMPVVSTDYKYGAGEIVEDGKSGILVPVGDGGKMADAILKLIRNRELAVKMGEEAKKRAEFFSVEKMVGETLRIFNEIPEGQT